jgi:hypothetical protein
LSDLLIFGSSWCCHGIEVLVVGASIYMKNATESFDVMLVMQHLPVHALVVLKLFLMV